LDGIESKMILYPNHFYGNYGKNES